MKRKQRLEVRRKKNNGRPEVAIDVRDVSGRYRGTVFVSIQYGNEDVGVAMVFNFNDNVPLVERHNTVTDGSGGKMRCFTIPLPISA